MTTFSVDGVRFGRPVLQGAGRSRAVALVDETVALRRCALWRNAFKRTAVSFPFALLGSQPLADWLRRHRLTVDVATAAEFNVALASGIRAGQLVMTPRDADAITCARRGGAARFVIQSAAQAATLARGADHVQRVVIAAGGDVGKLAAEVLSRRELDLVGLHCTVDDPDDPIGAVGLRSAMADIAAIRRRHAVVVPRVSLAGLDGGVLCREPRVLRRVAEAIGDVLQEECERYRLPRPALTVAPRSDVLHPRGVDAA